MELYPAQLKDELAAAQTDNQRLREEVERLRQDLESSHKTNKRLQAKYSQLAKNVDALSLEPLKDTEKLFHADKEKILSRTLELEEKYRIAVHHNKAKDERLQILEKAVDEQAMKAMMETPSQLAHAAAELVASKEREELARRKIRELEQKLASSQQQAGVLEGQLTSAQERIRTLREHKTRLEDELAEEQRAAAEAADEAASTIRGLRRDIAEMEAQNVTQSDNLTKTRQEVDELRRRIKILSDEVSLLTDKNIQAEAGRQSAERRMQQQEVEVEEMKIALQEAREREDEVMARQMEAEAVLLKTKQQREELKRLRDQLIHQKKETKVLSRRSALAVTAKVSEGAARKDAEDRARQTSTRLQRFQAELQQEVESRKRFEEENRLLKLEVHKLSRHIEKFQGGAATSTLQFGSGQFPGKTKRSTKRASTATGNYSRSFSGRLNATGTAGHRVDVAGELLASVFDAEEFENESSVQSDDAVSYQGHPDDITNMGEFHLVQMAPEFSGTPGAVQVAPPKSDVSSSRLLRVSKINEWLRAMARTYGGVVYTKETERFMYSVARKLAALVWQRRVVEARAVLRIVTADKEKDAAEEAKLQVELARDKFKRMYGEEKNGKTSALAELWALQDVILKSQLEVSEGSSLAVEEGWTECWKRNVPLALARIDSLRQTQGKALDLSNLSISNADFKAIHDLIIARGSVKHVNLQGNLLGQKSVKGLLSLFAQLQAPVNLSFSERKDGEDDEELGIVDLRGNRLSDAAIETIRQSLLEFRGCGAVTNEEGLLQMYSIPNGKEIRDGTAQMANGHAVGGVVLSVDCRNQVNDEEESKPKRGGDRRLGPVTPPARQPRGHMKKLTSWRSDTAPVLRPQGSAGSLKPLMSPLEKPKPSLSKTYQY